MSHKLHCSFEALIDRNLRTLFCFRMFPWDFNRLHTCNPSKISKQTHHKRGIFLDEEESLYNLLLQLQGLFQRRSESTTLLEKVREDTSRDLLCLKWIWIEQVLLGKNVKHCKLYFPKWVCVDFFSVWLTYLAPNFESLYTWIEKSCVVKRHSHSCNFLSPLYILLL